MACFNNKEISLSYLAVCSTAMCILVKNNGITMSGVETFQQINYRGGGGGRGDDYSGVKGIVKFLDRLC